MRIKTKFSLVAALVAAALALAGCGGSDKPKCQPHSQKCEQTSDGAWVPYWYFLSLQQAQNTRGAPSSAGKQPSAQEEEQNGAPKSAVSGSGGGSGAQDEESPSGGGGGSSPPPEEAPPEESPPSSPAGEE